MNVRPVLGEWEIPRIARIESLERRSMVELPIPGRVGSLFQDLNAAPLRLAISGSLYGDEARDAFLEEVRASFQAGEPLTFVADIVTATELQYVVIDTLRFEERGTEPDQIDYLIVLRESPPPPPPGDPLADLEAGLLDDAAGFLDSVTGALDAIDDLGSIPDLRDPTERLAGALDDVQSTVSGLASIGPDLASVFGESE